MTLDERVDEIRRIYDDGYKGREAEAAFPHVRDLLRAYADMKARADRLEGRICLICGRSEPCKETPEVCTFDPSPIEAAQEFQRKLHAANERIAALTKALEYLVRSQP